MAAIDGAAAALMTATTTRAMEIVTPLGPDVLLFHQMRGREALSRMSDYQVTLLSRHDIEFDDILGRAVSIRLALADGGPREFNGYVTRIAQHGTRGRYNRYRATVSPWLWFLTRTSDCRVFQDRTVPEIVDAVFANHPADHRWELTTDYRRRPYCVQYRESDFSFVSRLLEEEGIYYYFTHRDGRNTVVLTDSSASHAVFPGYARVPFRRSAGRLADHDEHIETWSVSRQVQPGAYAHRDYDPERPNVELFTRAATRRGYAQGHDEHYDYPGAYFHKAEGERYAAVRLEEYSSRSDTARAATNARGVAVGHRLTLTGHPREDQNLEYVVRSAAYDLEFSDYEAMPERRDPIYRCRFAAIPSERQFRPSRRARKPFVRGLQTAIVVGPEGQEIHADALGRIKVQFHWDRYGRRDEHSSCWIRVSQFWAGHHFGALFTPRIGQEVLVDFIEGDPDRPIVVGRVYNGLQKPPYDLPAHQTQSGVKTRSTPNGAATAGNEIRFEDRKGNEELFMHAERTMTIRVDGSESHHVGGSRSVAVGGGQNTTIAKDYNVTVTEGAFNVAVKQQRMLVDVPNAQFHVCGKNIWHVADEELLSTVHDSSLLMDRTSMFLSGTGEIAAEVLGNTLRIDPTSISLSALARITLACGASRIELTPAGIQISSPGPVDVKGLPIKLNS